MKVTMNAEIPNKIGLVRASFDRAGLNLSNGNSVASRLAAAERFHSAASSFSPREADMLRHVGEALMLADIVSGLEGKVGLVPHLKKLLSESDFYDKLIELLFATHLIQAGYGLEDREPDWIAVLGSVRFAVACKRVSSENAMLNGLRKARAQIKKSGLPGVVVMDVSWFPGTVPAFVATTARDAMDGLIASSRDIVGPTRPAIKAQLKGDLGVFGIMFHQSQCAFLPEKPDLSEGYYPTALHHYAGLWSRRPALIDHLISRFRTNVEM